MITIISTDLETRSLVDLKKHGARRYFDSPSTAILCMAYQVEYYKDGDLIDFEPTKSWLPGDFVPDVFFNEGVVLRAWNANEFERLAWYALMTPQHGFPHAYVEDWQCSAFMSRCNNLPNGLANAARCLNLDIKKDYRGQQLIQLLSVPQADGTFREDASLMLEMIAYCMKDVDVECAITRQLRMPSADEWHDYYATCHMNDLGLGIDLPLCQAAQSYAEEEEQDLRNEIIRLTDGVIDKARGEKLKAWVMERLTEDQLKLMTKHKNGEAKLSLDKQNRQKLLATELDPIVRQVVEASDAIQKSSVGKFRAMEDRASADHRVRGAFMVNGASQTGRWSSSGAQIHNFPRAVFDDDTLANVRQDLIDDIRPEDISDAYDTTIMGALSKMLRSAIIPAPGYVFLDADYASIEGRVAPWLCNSEAGEMKLDVYRNNIDPYRVAAAGIYSVDYDDIAAEGDHRRQVGKVAELALQFGGGPNAFLGMGAGYGLSMSTDEAAPIVYAWRQNNPWATQMWAQLNTAFTLAAKQPGEEFHCGRVMFIGVENILAGGVTVFCILPDGRPLTYPDVRIELIENQYGWNEEVTYLRSSWTPKATEREWPRSTIWGGTLLENITQAAAASLMRWAVRKLDDQEAPLIATIHDQALMEVPIEEQEFWHTVLHEAMNSAPAWADGLPIKADVKVCERFGK